MVEVLFISLFGLAKEIYQQQVENNFLVKRTKTDQRCAAHLSLCWIPTESSQKRRHLFRAEKPAAALIKIFQIYHTTMIRSDQDFRILGFEL